MTDRKMQRTEYAARLRLGDVIFEKKSSPILSYMKVIEILPPGDLGKGVIEVRVVGHYDDSDVVPNSLRSFFHDDKVHLSPESARFAEERAEIAKARAEAAAMTPEQITADPAAAKLARDALAEGRFQTRLRQEQQAKRLHAHSERIRAKYRAKAIAEGADPKVWDDDYEPPRKSTEELRDEMIQMMEEAGKSAEEITRYTDLFDQMIEAQREFTRETGYPGVMAALDGEIYRMERVEAIERLQWLARRGAEAAALFAKKFGHTGVPEEVEMLQDASRHLSEWQWTMTEMPVGEES